MASLRVGASMILTAVYCPVGVMHQALHWSPLRDGHLQRVDHQLLGHVAGHRPPHDPAREQVLHVPEVQLPLPRRDLGDVRRPRPPGGSLKLGLCIRAPPLSRRSLTSTSGLSPGPSFRPNAATTSPPLGPSLVNQRSDGVCPGSQACSNGMRRPTEVSLRTNANSGAPRGCVSACGAIAAGACSSPGKLAPATPSTAGLRTAPCRRWRLHSGEEIITLARVEILYAPAGEHIDWFEPHTILSVENERLAAGRCFLQVDARDQAPPSPPHPRGWVADTQDISSAGE